MKHKPIRVDWDELEVAFTNHDEEIVYYLDLVTGKVLIEGEGEDDDFDDDEEDFSPNTLAAAAAQPAPVDDTTRAYVKPVTTELKLGWMAAFLAEKDNGLDPETRTRLTEAFESENAAEALSAFLRGADEARDIWYLYRSNRLHEHMQAWLEGEEITPIDPPPWG